MGRVTKGSKTNNGHLDKLHVVFFVLLVRIFHFLHAFFFYFSFVRHSFNCFVKKRNKFWSRRNE